MFSKSFKIKLDFISTTSLLMWSFLLCSSEIHAMDEPNEELKDNKTIPCQRLLEEELITTVIAKVAQEDLAANVTLGLSYIKKGDHQKAFDCFMLVAEQEYPVAQFWLGWMNEKGLAVKEDHEKAFYYYGLAAQQGNAQAQCNLGLLYYHGLGVGKDDKESIRYLKLAADQNNVQAQRNLSVILEEVEQDFDGAIHYLNLAVNQGDADAQYELGMRYFLGDGVKKNDKEAYRYLKLAFVQGHSQAQNQLNNSPIIKLAADKGCAEAQNALACKYNNENNFQQAIYYYKLAAAQNNAMAIYNLSLVYHHGTGVQKDEKEAFRYLRLSADQGYEPAVELLSSLAQHPANAAATETNVTKTTEEDAGQKPKKKKRHNNRKRKRKQKQEQEQAQERPQSSNTDVPVGGSASMQKSLGEPAGQPSISLSVASSPQKHKEQEKDDKEKEDKNTAPVETQTSVSVGNGDGQTLPTGAGQKKPTDSKLKPVDKKGNAPKRKNSPPASDEKTAQDHKNNKNPKEVKKDKTQQGTKEDKKATKISQNSEESQLLDVTSHDNVSKYKDCTFNLYNNAALTKNEFLFPLRYLHSKGDITLRYGENKVVAVGTKKAAEACIIHCHSDHRHWWNKPENREAAQKCISEHESKEVKMLRRGVGAVTTAVQKVKNVVKEVKKEVHPSKDKKKGL